MITCSVIERKHETLCYNASTKKRKVKRCKNIVINKMLQE